MTENEKIIFELLDEYADALNDYEVKAAKNKLKRELTRWVLDDIIESGNQKDKAEAMVDFLTRDVQEDIDYSEILGKFKSNTIIDKVSGLPLQEMYSGYLMYDKYNEDIEKIINNGIFLKQQLEANGEYDYEGKMRLIQSLQSEISIASKALSNQPLASNAYKTYITYSGTKAIELAYSLVNHTAALDIAFYIADGIILPMQFDNLTDSTNWINGPTLDEMEKLYNGEYGYISEEDLKIFDPYVSWRYQYEVELELDKSGIPVVEYNDVMNNIMLDENERNYKEIIDKFFEMLGDKATNWVLETFPGIENKVNAIYEYFDNLPSIWELICKKEAHGVAFNRKNIPNRSCLRNIRKTFTTASNTVYDPIILDLDGDGFNVETKENGTNFDLDKNGFAEKINWTTKDGLLCLDLNGNGNIDNGGEVFGDQTLLADGTKAKNGFEALAQYDSNSDGVIDANDEIYSNLRVWVDGDGDGISASGELKTLADLGITSINLAYENVNAETGTEATIGNSATFTYADGTVGNAGELWVSSDLFDTVDKIDIEIPDDIKDLPNVGSIGNVYSLHNAMALDETGELKTLVESFAAEQDMDKRMETVQKILYFITGANDVADGSRGAYMDAKQLAVIEAMLGEAYVGTTGRNPHSDAAPMLKEAYADLLNMYYCELASQTYIKDYVQLLRYTENEDGTKVLNADLVNYILEYQLANGDENAKNILGDVARYVKYLDNGGIKGMSAFFANYAAISAEYAAEVVKVMPNGYVADGVNALNGTDNADLLVGSINGETISAGSGNDTLLGGKGNDTLYGGKGSDTYIFNLGDGNDVVNEDNKNTLGDKIVFGEGISADDIIVTRSGNDMVLKIKDTEDSIRIVNQYYDSWYTVESFEFADGTTVSADVYYNTSLKIKGSGVFGDYDSGFGTRNTTLIGSDEADTIYGYSGNDILSGGKGNDTLYGGKGSDTYIFNLGDGNDVVNEDNKNTLGDKIVFGEGISADDIIVTRSGNDMVLKIKDTEDSIKIVNQYNDSWYTVENFEFADGTTVSADTYYNTSLEIKGSGEFGDYDSGFGTRNTTLIGSDEADTIYGYSGNDILSGGKGNDTLYGGKGSDTYIFNLGDGNDVVNEDNKNTLGDKIVFGEGISINEIIFNNSGQNMEITFTDSTDSVTIINQNYDSWYRVENFATSDGYTIDYSKVNQLIQAMASFEADTGMSWTEAVEQGNETANSIVSEIWVKSVS